MWKAIVESDMATVRVAHDGIQERLSEFGHSVVYEMLSHGAIEAAKLRILDTMGTLVAGYSSAPSKILRGMASRMYPDPQAMVIGSEIRTNVDIAALVNTTAARYIDMNDFYDWPGTVGRGHPSDMISPIVTFAEFAGSSGRDVVTAVATAYEVYCRMADVSSLPGFDSANLTTIGVTIGVGRLLGLSRDQLAQALSLAVIPNIALGQTRVGQLSMWKAVAAGQAGRAAIFAVLLAAEGMEGPTLPFEGQSGLIQRVASKFGFDLPGVGTLARWKIETTLIKPRACCAPNIASALAAEKIATGIPDIEMVKSVLVETYACAVEKKGIGEHHWNPRNRETADHSLPYVVAVALMDGLVEAKQFDDEHLRDRRILELMRKIRIAEDAEFTRLYCEQPPAAHSSRVTVTLQDGSELGGLSGSPNEDFADFSGRSFVVEKFHRLTDSILGASVAKDLVSSVGGLEEMHEISSLLRMLAIP